MKNKLKKFAEMETFDNVFQCSIHDITEDNPVAQLAGHWNEQVFHNDHPIVLELGCGRGEYTVGMAQRYPDKNFIGIDIKGARMWAAQWVPLVLICKSLISRLIGSPFPKVMPSVAS